MYLLGKYELMYQKQVRFLELCHEMTERVNEMEKMAKALQLPWEGEANRQFLLRLGADYLEITQTMEKLNSAGELLLEIIEQYQNTEGVVSEIIAGIKT